jgi:hypothetical protein
MRQIFGRLGAQAKLSETAGLSGYVRALDDALKTLESHRWSRAKIVELL